MDEENLQQLFAELIESIEPLETQNAALLQLLKSKGVVTDEELAPFLERAGNASGIRWHAVQLRTRALLSSALRPSSEPGERNAPATTAEATKKTGEDKSEPAGDKKADEERGQKAESEEGNRATAHRQEKQGAQAAVSQAEDGRPDEKRGEDRAGERKPDKKTDEDLRDSKLSNPPLIQTGKQTNDQGADEPSDARSRPGQSGANKPSQSEAA